MTIDSMRFGGGGRCPLLVGCLVLACIMMVCNWWTLSSTNLELLKQIDDLNDQIKINVEERDQCVTMKENVEKQHKTSQDDARTAHVKLSQVEDSLTTCDQELKSFQQKDVSKTATLDTLRMAKNTITARLNAKIEENKKLEEDLNKVKKELEDAKQTMNAPQQKPVPVLPIAKLLEKSDNKTASIAASQANAAVNKTMSIGNNQAPNPQMNAPPNAENVDAQEAQEKDNSNIKEDNAAEVHGDNGNEQEFNFDLLSDAKNRDNQVK